jgi:hypothetical protein
MPTDDSKQRIARLRHLQAWETQLGRLLGGWLPGIRFWEAKQSIIDETMHVRWGQRWVPELMKHQAESKDLDSVIVECRQAVLDNSLAPAQRSSAAKTTK